MTVRLDLIAIGSAQSVYSAGFRPYLHSRQNSAPQGGQDR
jgi:hypothetical protein